MLRLRDKSELGYPARLESSLHVIFVDAEGERELFVSALSPTATVADLASALGGQPNSLLRIDNRRVSSDLGLFEVGLVEGSTLELDAIGSAHADERDSYPVLLVRVVAGLDSGAAVPLGPGSAIVGRNDDCAVTLRIATISRTHCLLDVQTGGRVEVRRQRPSQFLTVDGQETKDGVVVGAGARLDLGAAMIELSLPASTDRPTGIESQVNGGPNGLIPFNRPPRSRSEPPTDLIEVPVEPLESAKPPFNAVSILSPLLFGLVMVAVQKNWAFAFFALPSLLMVCGNWYETRHRSVRSLRRASRKYAADVREFEEDLTSRWRHETARLPAALPDPAEVLRRAVTPSVRLWERRSGHDDFMLMSVGVADLPWQPPTQPTTGVPSREVARVLTKCSVLPSVPVPVSLAAGHVLGVVGERGAALALVRGLLTQFAVLHGPADAGLVLLLDNSRAADWDWAKWIPHIKDPLGSMDQRRIAIGEDDCDRMVRDQLARGQEGPKKGPLTLVVIDAERLTQGRDAPARALLRGEGGPVSGIVIFETEDKLPAVCSTVVELVDPYGTAELRRPALGERVEQILIAGISEETSRRCVRALARFEDPELRVPGSNLPGMVRLPPLLGLDDFSQEALRRRWAQGSVAAPVGVGERGPFIIDLARHGPHGLIGGTTGSGKSELLRSLVLSLAATAAPQQVTFVLIDFKGGSTFDALGALPHTVGLATDLDDQLAERSLRCLQAELRYREQQFRDQRTRGHSFDDLDGYNRAMPNDPMARLVVIIDEFAEMVGALPHLLDSLEGIARRGRSLGVHLLLATQRPAGAVNDQIRTNTDLKIALRVQEPSDSTDVIGVPDAALIPRAQVGRALVRFGPSEILAVQTALATAIAPGPGHASVVIAPFMLGGRQGLLPHAAASGTDATTNDLARMIGLIRREWDSSGSARPRRPWTDPLPLRIPLDSVASYGSSVDSGILAFAVADDPDHQSQYPTGWDLASGNLLLYGVVGSGTTTALAAIARSLAASRSPDEAHLYVLDIGPGALVPLGLLPHTGAVVLAGERERQLRLIAFLSSEIDRRKELGPGAVTEPAVVVLVDGYGSFASLHTDLVGMEALENFARVYADGPSVGVHTAITADRTSAIPSSLEATTPQKLVFKLPDVYDYSVFGLAPREVPRPAPGRAVDTMTKRVVQVGFVDLDAIVEQALGEMPRGMAYSPPGRRPSPIGVLPERVDVASLVATANIGGPRPWVLPLGIASSTLAATGVSLHAGEHVTIAGPGRSGKSSVLSLIAVIARAANPQVRLLGIAPRPSPLRDRPELDLLITEAAELDRVRKALEADAPAHLILIDDADSLADTGGLLARLVQDGRHDLHVVIAGRSDVLRSMYGHWTQDVRRSRLGLLLRPNLDVDGETLSTPLPRRQWIPNRPGRGWLVANGETEFLQTACVND
jgi:S-DNA-T family DNA segregation ATPase FtsK/SpoIIIE